MAHRNFTLRIDEILLANFLEACRAQDQTASQYIRNQMRDYVRGWRNQQRPTKYGTHTPDDELNPGFDHRQHDRGLHVAATLAKEKRVAAEKRAEEMKAEVAKRLAEMKTGKTT